LHVVMLDVGVGVEVVKALMSNSQFASLRMIKSSQALIRIFNPDLLQTENIDLPPLGRTLSQRMNRNEHEWAKYI